jgi:hypothetical protein
MLHIYNIYFGINETIYDLFYLLGICVAVGYEQSMLFLMANVDPHLHDVNPFVPGQLKK